MNAAHSANPMTKKTRLALAALVGVHFFSFYATKLANQGRTHIQLTTRADGLLPFWPAFVVVYVLAFVQWFCCYFYLYRKHPAVFRRAAWGSAFAELPALAIFLLMPTAILRPDSTGGGVFGWMLGVIYRCDTPVNCFPSLHCLQSWLCWRMIRLAPGHSSWYDRGNLIFSLLVCASTVLIRQHFVLDIPGGILCAELGLLLTRRSFRPAKG